MEMPQYDLPPAELIIPLDPPVKNPSGGEVHEITLQEPTSKQVAAAETHLRNGVNPQSLRSYQFALVGSVSQLSRQVLDAVPITKLQEAAAYLQGFITPPPRIGES